MPEHREILRTGIFVVFAATIIAVTVLGNQELERVTSQRSAQNNEAACRSFGFDPASQKFVSCIEGLRELIRQHEQAHASAGLL